MDLKNTLAAVSLSVAVIVLWGLFMQPPPEEIKKIQEEKNTTIETTTTDAPSLDQNEEVSKISRDESLEENERVILTKID